MGLFQKTFLSLLCLPEQTELVITALKIDLLTDFKLSLSGLKAELWSYTLQGNMGKSSWFR